MGLVGHVDVDAFFASVEQRDKPSLRGRPVVVGGVGPRGVVATASYEARVFGVHSAMPMSEARRRCPQAAVLAGRFEVYRADSAAVMDVLRRHASPVEPVSLDEAYVALSADDDPRQVVEAIRADVAAATSLTASVGVGSSKLVAKIASDLAKPDGVLVVPVGGEQAFLDPLLVRLIPGVGPASQARLARLGVATVEHLRRLSVGEVVALLGEAHGTALWDLAHGVDPRPVTAEHEVKSVSVEETFETDLTDPLRVAGVLDRMALSVCERLRAAGTSGRTVTLKARYPDFTTVTRSATHPGPTDDARFVARTAGRLLADVDLARGVRLLGIGVSGLTPWVQDDLFEAGSPAVRSPEPAAGETPTPEAAPGPPRWRPGQDVVHEQLGQGWVWGTGLGRVTVRFETRDDPPGPVHTLDAADPLLAPLSGVAAPRRRPDGGRPPHPPAR